MTEEIHVDIDKRLPPHLREEANLLAMEEHPANMVLPDLDTDKPSDVEMAMDARKMWRPGRVLRIRFLDGHPTVQQRLIEVANEWTQYANLTFNFGNHAESELRITFGQPGSWSYIGTDAKLIAQDQPTMNFGWLKPESNQETYSQVVLHEFGHAIGCIHEHSTPDAGIQWNKQAVYNYYMGPPNNWSKDYVDLNIFDIYARGTTKHTQFDPESIMVYPIPKQFTLNGYEVAWRSRLSAMDKAFIGQVYP
ncbi:MAG: M12 family metallopeptidase [Chloroflexota bacterium]